MTTETFAAGVTLPRTMTVEEAELEIRPLREGLWKMAHGGPYGQSMENSARVEEARRQLKALRYLATMASRVPDLEAKLAELRRHFDARGTALDAYGERERGGKG